MSSNQYPLPFEMLQKWAAEIPDQVYLRQPVNRIYKKKTWREVYNEALRLAAATYGALRLITFLWRIAPLTTKSIEEKKVMT